MSGDDWFIEDETGKQLPALNVFSESIKYLKDSFLEEVKKQQTDIGVDDIKWIQYFDVYYIHLYIQLLYLLTKIHSPFYTK